ncbi:MAG: hypothetical protein KGL39_58395 [Patescibacteria group bacterium]|nr:hypothetical protein [Patescibacteria group bacterium]
MKMRWAHSQWAQEIRLLNRWARWCINGNHGEIMRLCGLTWAGSMRTIMERLWECGAAEEKDVTGYASEPPPLPDFASQEVDKFMTALRSIHPESHRAILGRHARIVHGEFVLIRSHGWVAQALYGRSRRASEQALDTDCNLGYAALRRWIQSAQEKAA